MIINFKFETKLIRYYLKELIADREFHEGRRITLDEVSKATGIHRSTLSKIANIKSYNTTTDVVDKLCDFFQVDVEKVIKHV